MCYHVAPYSPLIKTVKDFNKDELFIWRKFIKMAKGVNEKKKVIICGPTYSKWRINVMRVVLQYIIIK